MATLKFSPNKISNKRRFITLVKLIKISKKSKVTWECTFVDGHNLKLPTINNS
jgi:hypothetical protein